MPYETLLVDKQDQVLLLQLNRPEKLNALNEVMAEELLHVTRDLAADEDVGALVLTGAGQSFCAGGDLEFLSRDYDLLQGIEYVKKVHPWIRAVAQLEKPVIAAVNGAAAGGGFSMALFCDIILAGEHTRFSLAFSRIGLVPDLAAMYFLPRLVGLQRAKDLIFTGRQIDAREANQMGIVSRVVPDDDLLEEALKLAAKLAAGPRVALRQSKQILNQSMQLNLEQLLDLEAYAQGVCFQTEDFREGAGAFLEKRPPAFKGK